MDAKEALTEGFQRWLDAALPSPSQRFSFESVDPFATSTRSANKLIAGLQAVKNGDLPKAFNDASQKLADLGSAGLAQGHITSQGGFTLTPLGRDVLDRLKDADLIDVQPSDASKYEMPRSLVLLRCGLKAQVLLYQTLLERWRLLRSHRPAGEWFGDPWGLTAAQYFLKGRRGYSPYRVMIAAGCSPWEQRASLEEWADATPPAPGISETRLAGLLRRIEDGATRAKSRIAFCQAMEVDLLQSEGASRKTLEVQMLSWGIESA